ncbi:amino acid permease [Promicromonospora sp. NPDC060204]|uniref:amino acid permease n=1 Tax=Promicromonospora sp. NPDC060204 TaxID=3347071 RepID=UPI003649736F
MEENARPGTHRAQGLGVVTGSVMLLGAVLGPGALALPTLAADAAGPASLLAWALLLLASIPVAATFAALGGTYPDGGGVAHFAAIAFDGRIAAAVSWWFLAAVPLGVTAAGLMGGQYVVAALDAGPGFAMGVGFGLLVASFVLNAVGLQVTGRIQVLTAAIMVTLLVVAVTVSLDSVRSEAFTPFAPHGWAGVGTAATVLFFAFAGWEAATHLSADFADPGRGLRRATALTLALVIVLYLGLAVVTLGVLGPAAGHDPAPLLTLLQRSFGTTGTALATAAALLLTFGAVNAYLASGARLGAALGRDRTLPRWLVGRTTPAREPRRSLAFLAACCLVVTVPVFGGVVTLDGLVRATSALLAAVTLTGTLAGIRLLRGWQRGNAVVASVFLGVVLVFCGALLMIPVGIGAAAVLAQLRRHDGERPSPASDGTHAAARTRR